MKVVYKKTILEKIDEEIDKAVRKKKEIDYIQLTWEEYEELFYELRSKNIRLEDPIYTGYGGIYRGVVLYCKGENNSVD